ncbi:MAG: ribbon-helix-helix domain-containing protein [Nostoc sp. CmiVER01]|uniref:ribbon-helix-helix domain-containing protein n=1 Tax=Nostoc sp. CmiVER01 TaxID=3075384 RepID=UPI002AD4D562|nr:hypothetical protein [Nostoc sp. CmiVER01]MDZ8126588.1 hypothetical protein [Nostoc sp. CmiVER01]
MPSNWRITVTLPEQFKEFLEQWAENEHRSVSNLAASILINAAQDKISISELEIQKSKSQALKKSNPQTKAKAKPKSTNPNQSA